MASGGEGGREKFIQEAEEWGKRPVYDTDGKRIDLEKS